MTNYGESGPPFNDRYAEVNAFASRLPELMDGLTEVRRARRGKVVHYTSPDSPAVYIRATDKSEWLLPTTDQDSLLERQRIAYANLELAGFQVVPFALTTSRDKFFAITHKVLGQPLDELPSSPWIAAQYDTAISSALNFIGRHRGDNMSLPADIFDASQSMWGTLYGENISQDGLLFVDVEVVEGGMLLDCRTEADPTDYTDTMGLALAAALSYESDHQIRLPGIRATVAEQLELVQAQVPQMQQSVRDVVAWRSNRFQEALATGDPAALGW